MSFWLTCTFCHAATLSNEWASTAVQRSERFIAAGAILDSIGKSLQKAASRVRRRAILPFLDLPCLFTAFP